MAAAAGKVARSAYGVICRAALQQTGEHPEITFRRDALLRSINDRLGELCDLLGARGAGESVPPLTRRYLGELYDFAVADAEDTDRALEEGRKSGSDFDRLRAAIEGE